MRWRHAVTLGSAPPLVLFAPLPPLASGIADYASELMPGLARFRPVICVIDDAAPQPEPSDACSVIRLAQYQADAARFDDSPHLYHLGNNRHHVYMLPTLLRRPGVVVLHDVSLHHLMDQATLAVGDEQAYAHLVAQAYGAAGRVLAEQFLSRRWRGGAIFQELPMTGELLACSRAVIVHSAYAADKVRSQHPGLPVEVVAHHVAAAPARSAARLATRAQARALLGVDDGEVLLVSLGFVTRAKQIDRVLRFLAAHRAGLPRLRYIVAGEQRPEELDVQALASELGLHDVVRVTGYVDEAAFYRHIAAADIVVNLRYPSGGETSGSMVRALGMGACVVVNDIGPFSEYPDEVCAKVGVDAGVGGNDAHFARTMQALIGQPALRQRLGRAAARHMHDTHGLALSAQRYSEIVARHGRPPGRASRAPPVAAYAEVADHEQALRALTPAARAGLALWAREGCVPLAAADDEVLVVNGPSPAPHWLSALFGYGAGQVRSQHAQRVGALDCVAGSLRLVLLHLRVEPGVALGDWLRAINPCLRRHGHLLLSLHADDAATLAASRRACAAQWDAAGFTLEITRPARERLSFALDADADAAAGDDAQGLTWLARARKTSAFMRSGAGQERLEPA